MSAASKLRAMFSAVNYIRTLPVYLCIAASPHRELVEMDFARWRQICAGEITQMGLTPGKSRFSDLNWLLLYKKEFRSLLLHRFRKPPKTVKTIFHFVITRMLWKPLDSLYLYCEDIGGGLFIQHGFSTIVCAEHIGENCWINQQVTIGYNGLDCPTLEDNVVVHCGAKVLGKITMKKGSVAAAGAVVIRDVPENAVVGGVPAKVLKYHD